MVCNRSANEKFLRVINAISRSVERKDKIFLGHFEEQSAARNL